MAGRGRQRRPRPALGKAGEPSERGLAVSTGNWATKCAAALQNGHEPRSYCTSPQLALRTVLGLAVRGEPNAGAMRWPYQASRPLSGLFPLLLPSDVGRCRLVQPLLRSYRRLPHPLPGLSRGYPPHASFGIWALTCEVAEVAPRCRVHRALSSPNREVASAQLRQVVMPIALAVDHGGNAGRNGPPAAGRGRHDCQNVAMPAAFGLGPSSKGQRSAEIARARQSA